MLNGLMRDCTALKLEKLPDELGFRIQGSSEAHGEFEYTGPLLYVLGQASEPFMPLWQQRGEAFREALKALDKS